MNFGEKIKENTDDEEKLDELIQNFKLYAVFGEILTLYAGYQRRPVNDLTEVRRFIKYMIDNVDDEDAEERLENVLSMSTHINKDILDENSLEQQEMWLKFADEYLRESAEPEDSEENGENDE